jgi:hypothetical protein
MQPAGDIPAGCDGFGHRYSEGAASISQKHSGLLSRIIEGVGNMSGGI